MLCSSLHFIGGPWREGRFRIFTFPVCVCVLVWVRVCVCVCVCVLSRARAWLRVRMIFISHVPIHVLFNVFLVNTTESEIDLSQFPLLPKGNERQPSVCK